MPCVSSTPPATRKTSFQIFNVANGILGYDQSKRVFKSEGWLLTGMGHATVEWYLFHVSPKNGYAKVSFRMIIFVSSGEGIKCSKKYGKYEFTESYL